MNFAGKCLRELGSTENALKLFIESFNIMKNNGLINNDETCECLSNIGVCFKELGDPENALKYLIIVLKMEKTMYPEISI